MNDKEILLAYKEWLCQENDRLSEKAKDIKKVLALSLAENETAKFNTAVEKITYEAGAWDHHVKCMAKLVELLKEA